MIENGPIIIIFLVIFLCILLGVSVFLRKEFLKPKQQNTSIELGNAQYIGTREKQDDSFGSCKRNYGLLAIVADGIGGFVNGDIASRITVDTFISEFKKTDVLGNVNYYYQSASQKANFQIRKQFEDTPCGTTVVSVIIKDKQLFWCSVGDSNIAIYRNKRLIMINTKENVENWLEEQYMSGKIKREEALNHPQQRRLMNYIGYDGFVGGEIGKRPITLLKGDKVLLYSDGVETLSQIELEKILSEKLSANDTAEKIIQQIRYKNVKSKDNATIIVINIK